MIVYVETNFVLEIAREQEQVEAANQILTLVEQGKIELAFPGFTLSEPFSTIIRQRKDRKELLRSLQDTLVQLRRSETHKNTTDALEPVLDLLNVAVERDLDLLHATIERMLKTGRSLETDISNFRQAVDYQKRFDLSPQDSIIYSAIIADISRRPAIEDKRFLSRDNEAFATNLAIKRELRKYNCRYIGSFKDGLASIEHAL
jgi:predicted nucleic acid-binding protein